MNLHGKFRITFKFRPRCMPNRPLWLAECSQPLKSSMSMSFLASSSYLHRSINLAIVSNREAKMCKASELSKILCSVGLERQRGMGYAWGRRVFVCKLKTDIRTKVHILNRDLKESKYRADLVVDALRPDVESAVLSFRQKVSVEVQSGPKVERIT